MAVVAKLNVFRAKVVFSINSVSTHYPVIDGHSNIQNGNLPVRYEKI